MICPKCNFEQIDTRPDCIKCGIIFSKYAVFGQRLSEHSRSVPVSPRSESHENPASGLMDFLKELLLYVKPDINPFYFGGRIIIFLVIFTLGLKFILSPMAVTDTGKRALHLINLPFHEAGHILFLPLGGLMTGLGGSLMQLLVPLLCLLVFLFKSRDTFGASITLWWLGESFMDLAPYINDARQMSMILIGGITGRDDPDMHDWHHILRDMGMLQYDHTLALGALVIGIVLMILSFIWGGYLLFRQFKNIEF